MITLQKSLEGNIYNEFKLNLYFELNLVYMYTNISFTEKQREDEFKLYDTLRSNGFFESFYEALDDKEYEELFDQIAELKSTMEKSKGSVAGVIANIIEDLPVNAEAAAKIVENFDPSQFQAVVDFARYANGGRDINTNQPVDVKTPLEILK